MAPGKVSLGGTDMFSPRGYAPKMEDNPEGGGGHVSDSRGKDGVSLYAQKHTSTYARTPKHKHRETQGSGWRRGNDKPDVGLLRL